MSGIDFRKETDTDPSYSQGVWGDCPVQRVLEDGIGFMVEEQFQQFELPGGTTDHEVGPWRFFLDSGSAVADGAEFGGSLLLTEDTNDEGLGMRVGQANFQISTLKGDFWAEIRLKNDTVTDDTGGWFWGLREPTAMTKTVPIQADGTIADENLVGWFRDENDGDAVDCIYKADGVTAVTVESGAATLVADTYIKLGMKKIGNILTFYQNGTTVATKKTLPATSTGTDFPADTLMAPTFGMLNDSGGSMETELYFMRYIQLFETAH